jgi:signal transduction histidine kinase/DNA-binding response OmpR family regulator/streptogramin lyase
LYKSLKILCGLLFPLLLYGQPEQEYQLISRYIGTRDGLTNLTAHHTLTDSRGFVWISTNGGLFQYDGKRANPVITKMGTNAFKAGYIYEGPNHCIWNLRQGYALFATLNIWNPDRQQSLSPDSLFQATRAPFKEEDIEAIGGTADRKIVFLLKNGQILTYDGQAYRNRYKVEEWAEYQEFYVKGYTAYFEKQGSALAIDLSTYGEEQAKVIACDYFPNQACCYQYLPDNATAQVVLNELPGKPVIRIPKLAQSPLAIAYTSDRMLWIATPDSISVWGPISADQPAYYTQIASEAVTLSPSLIQELRVEPQEQRAWVATTKGVYLFELSANYFQSFHNLPDVTTDPRGIAMDNLGILYFNDYEIYRYDTAVTLFDKDISATLHLLYEDEGLWCSSYQPMIERIDLKSRRVTTFPYPAGEGLFATTWMYRSRYSGTLFVGSTQGLLQKPQNADTLCRVPTCTSADLSEIRYIHENQAGLWLCTAVGLFLYQESSDSCVDYSSITQYAAVNHLHEAADGSFWIGSDGQGLYHWQPGTNSTERFDYQSGFSDEMILAIYSDKRGYLWMPTFYGLIRYHPDTQSLYTFTTEDGLPSNEFNRYSHYQMADGTLVFGTTGGMIKFNPRNIPASIGYAPPVTPTQIATISSNGQKTAIPLTQTSIRLSPLNGQLRLEFALLHHNSEKLEQFDYRLLGQNDQWTPMRGSTLDLTGFSKGQFILEVRGRKGKGAYSSSVYQLRIKVPPPFYQTTAFILGTVGAVIAALLLLFRLRTRRLRKEQLRLQQEVEKRTQKIHQQAVALEKLNQIKTTLITNIAHELKTPLTMISGTLQLMGSQQHPNPEKGLKTLEHNSSRLIQLIDQLVEVNKKEEILLELQTQPTDLSRLVKGIAQSYEDSEATQGISFSLDLDEHLPKHYLADALKLEYILHNLLSNAFKFTPKGGTVRLSVFKNDGNQGVHINVTDTGIGIPEAAQSRIFDRFFQVDSTAGGMGIGLAIVKDYTEAMNGAVKLESRPQHGTSVTIDLPLQAIPHEVPAKKLAATEVSNKKSELAASPPIKQKHLILIVEDKPDVQSLLSKLFAQQFELQIAADGQEALNYLNQPELERAPDLIITDLMMPNLDGLTLIQQLKTDERFKLTPILVLSAKSDPITKIKVLNIGVDDYVQKPFNLAELSAIVHNLLRNSNARLNATIASLATAQSQDMPPHSSKIKNHEQKLLKQVEKVLWKKIDKGVETKVKDLAQELHMSERQLQRQIKLLTGLTPSEYINEVRLQKARQLILEGTYSTVSEVAYQLGYTYPSYFSKVFTKRFGRPPSSFFEDRS